MATSLLNVGASGLQAAYAAMNTVSHNVANVNTPGYSRQETVQTTMPGMYTGGGFIGRGVALESVRRAYDSQVTNQLALAQSQSSESSTHAALMTSVDSLFSTDSSGLGAVLDAFTSAVTQASSRPADSASRATVLATANQLAARLNGISGQLDTLGQNADLAIRASVSDINGLTQRIGQLNDAIAAATATGQTPNDLLDQRDSLINDLNAKVGVTTMTQSDGSMNVFLSAGPALVLGDTVSKLSIAPDPTVPGRQLVGVTNGPNVVTMNASNLSGGELAGNIKFREVSLVNAQNNLGRLSVALASAYNQVHQAGTDLNGATGNPLFTTGAPLSYATSTNTGTGAVSIAIANASALQASDYRIDYNGTNYTITRSSDGTKTTAASFPIAIDGLTLTMAGAPAAGDSFTLQPVRGAAGGFKVAVTTTNGLAFGQSTNAGDNTNALALADIPNRSVLGTQTISQALGETAALIGTETSGLKLTDSLNTKLLTQAQASQSSVSGVNLDEEAANLMRYQQAYQASAKVMSAAQTIFDTLLSLGK
jgi:flagellar hook-associated protein 1 FlgK